MFKINFSCSVLQINEPYRNLNWLGYTLMTNLDHLLQLDSNFPFVAMISSNNEWN